VEFPSRHDVQHHRGVGKVLGPPAEGQATDIVCDEALGNIIAAYAPFRPQIVDVSERLGDARDCWGWATSSTSSSSLLNV
jgi:hypothetical protein